MPVPAQESAKLNMRVLQNPQVRRFNRQFFSICKLADFERKIGVESGFWSAQGNVSNSYKVDHKFSVLAKSSANAAFAGHGVGAGPNENFVKQEILAISFDGAMNISKESLRANTLRYIFQHGAKSAVNLYHGGEDKKAIFLISNLLHFFKSEKEIPDYLRSELLPLIKSTLESVTLFGGRTLLDFLPGQVRGIMDDFSGAAAGSTVWRVKKRHPALKNL